MGQNTKDRITNPTGGKLGGNPFAESDTDNNGIIPTGGKLGGVPEDVLSQQSTQTTVQQPRVEQQKQTHENGGTQPKANSGQPPVNDGSAKVQPEQDTTQNQVRATSPESVQKESATPTTQKTMTYEEMFRMSNPYTPPTPEELEKERKKKKREAIFAAIGDGVAALSNLAFTSFSFAPSSFDAKNTMSSKWQKRWDKIEKEREGKNKEYYQGYMRARMADDEVARDNRNWEYKVGRDKLADDRYTAEQAENKRRWEAGVKERAEQRKAEGERWQKQFDENQRQFNANQRRLTNQATQQANARIAAAKAAGARGVRGKQLGFADGNGNQVSIYENVWKGSMQQVYDAIIADGVASPTKLQEVEGMTPAQKEDFVKANWTKSPKAQTIMMALSKIDPATMTSEVQDGEDYSQYQQQDDDFSQYEVK
ncbi:MAG: hypothetical protein IKK89_08950 [Alistipes sp.]|nr:hypothetical protein [Alistipes sp.]